LFLEIGFVHLDREFRLCTLPLWLFFWWICIQYNANGDVGPLQYC